MTTIERFEDLPIWQEAREIVHAVYQMPKEFPSNERYGLVNQMQQTAISTMSHIAEGFERGTNEAFVDSLGAAKGSNGRVRSQTYAALDLWYISQTECDNMVQRCETLSNHLDEFIERLEHTSTINEAG
jgi:four helix bundle protein